MENIYMHAATEWPQKALIRAFKKIQSSKKCKRKTLVKHTLQCNLHTT